MGYRTVVILNNDLEGTWSRDMDLGRKISSAMSYSVSPSRQHLADFGHGLVVECVHADTQTLAVVDGFRFQPVLRSFWHRGETDKERDLRILREAAAVMGYQLVKQSPN